MRIPSIVILGADALIAALPATPIQLAHACALVGYQHVVPSSWGDELIAGATLRALHGHEEKPAIHCSCPFVAHRLLAVGTDLRPFLVSMVAPPIVLARYLRAVHGDAKLRITYVGRCPGAADEVIDARLTPEELLAIFADHQVVIADQPQVFDSVIPPDRRRFRSQPGGLPTPEMLWAAGGNGGAPRALVELYGDDLPVELAQQLLAGRPVLIDVAPKLGCVCSGAVSGITPTDARACVTALEPPRASSPVIDENVITNAVLPLPASPRSAIDIVAPSTHAAGTHTTTPEMPNDLPFADVRENGSASAAAAWPDVQGGTPHLSGRRHSPPRGVARPMSGALPIARDAEGRQLPRTYVARRRSPARVTRNTPSEAAPVIASQTEMRQSAPEPNETSVAPVATVATSAEQQSSPGQVAGPTSRSEGELTTGGLSTSGSPAGASALVSPAERATEELFPHRPPRTDPTPWVNDEPAESPRRFAERTVTLPVTPLSDGVRRDEPPPNVSGDRPMMQVLTLGLLIAMIVLISAAVGVLVGRWMSQR